MHIPGVDFSITATAATAATKFAPGRKETASKAAAAAAMAATASITSLPAWPPPPAGGDVMIEVTLDDVLVPVPDAVLPALLVVPGCPVDEEEMDVVGGRVLTRGFPG